MDFVIGMMSMRMGITKRMIRMRCGMISSAGTGIGNSVKTGNKAVDTGTVSSRLEE